MNRWDCQLLMGTFEKKTSWKLFFSPFLFFSSGESVAADGWKGRLGGFLFFFFCKLTFTFTTFY